MNILLDLYITFAKIGAFTIGGGMAMMPMMQTELVDKRHWMTEEDLIDYYAIGQSTPGIIAVNVSTFAGFRQKGIIGGIVSTLGMITPSLIIIMLLATFINSVNDIPLAIKALKGVNVAVAALLTKVTYTFCKKTVKNWWSLVLLLLSFCLIFFVKVPSAVIIVSGIVLGLIVSAVQVSKEKKSLEAAKSDSEGGKE